MCWNVILLKGSNMKLRIKGDSLRIRVSQPEMARLLQSGRIEETVHFGEESDSRLSYALEHVESEEEISLRHRPQDVTFVLSTLAARRWAEGDQVGIYGDMQAGEWKLSLSVEKDFACLDASAEDNKDTFPNPRSGTGCKDPASDNL